ncbi:MFS monocarboxylate transporter, putative [Metarhizium acridum CQMa 102]|uniref:MFS monocarboxylate transporter, putative n=1 Tax=Metarhizium acridum (strain CQMa 102) TaxID=655827 RepID=E9DU19_METAQ|nr:MFS monocarboxylate transporter, putative [Metarhizium acridum CQMa 102]EFY92879.1 MFS monocarboxylate transporter, putative [Metarhizium acridum CQMa 102]
MGAPRRPRVSMSLAWHESTYSSPRVAYERLKSGYSKKTDCGNSLYHPCAALSSSDGAADDSEPKLPTVITIDVAYSCWPRMKWSQRNRRWMPDTPDSTSNVDSSRSIADTEISHIVVPDGGLRAWLVVVGGFIVYFFIFGLLNAFGSFQDIYTDGSGFSTKFPHFLVNQGIFFGTGIALLYYPATGAITEWFNEKRPLALGIAASGSSVGGALWSTYVPELNDKLPHGVVFLVIGGIATPLLFLGCLLIRERKGAAGHDESGDEVRPSQRSIRSAVLEWRFLALTWSLVILYTGVLIPFHFLVVYAREKEVSEDVAYNLVAFTYLGSILGRIGSGLLADFFGW